MEFYSKKGPYVLEVKQRGNVILYEQKTKKIIWQTNTENKGKAPHNFQMSKH